MADQGYLYAGQSLWARAWTAAYRLYARSVCDTKALLQLQYVTCGAMPLPNPAYGFHMN